MIKISSIKDLVKYHEGCCTTPYRDTEGYWTIGYGHKLNLDKADLPTVWTREYIEEVLDQDIAGAIQCCKKIKSGYEDLDEVRQAVLTDMAFNLGCAGLQKFHKTLQYIWLKQYANAATEMLDSLWASQVPGRALRLSAMMRTGQWPKE